MNSTVPLFAETPGDGLSIPSEVAALSLERRPRTYEPDVPLPNVVLCPTISRSLEHVDLPSDKVDFMFQVYERMPTEVICMSAH
jgi:hypothetical protein